MNPKEMYFEANLIECNSDAKFPGYPWDERKIFMRILERERLKIHVFAGNIWRCWNLNS